MGVKFISSSPSVKKVQFSEIPFGGFFLLKEGGAVCQKSYTGVVPKALSYVTSKDGVQRVLRSDRESVIPLDVEIHFRYKEPSAEF